MIQKEDNIITNELLTIVLHDIQSPLRFIGTITQDLAVNCMVMDKETLQEHVRMLHNSVVSLQQYCKKINDWKNTKTEYANLIEQISINEIFTSIKEIYSPLLKAKKIKFNIIETDIHCISTKEILFIILINLIDNAYKYTNNGSIKMKAIEKNNKISMIVSDTGIGMKKEKIDAILADKQKLKHATLGYYIIKDLLKKINASIAINSIIGIGTQVIVSLSNPEKYDNASPSS